MGTNPLAEDRGGNSCIMPAAEEIKFKAIDLLISEVSLSAVDKGGKTVLGTYLVLQR